MTVKAQGNPTLVWRETPASVTKHLHHPRAMSKLLYEVTCPDDIVIKEEVIDGN
jgi:hypothetical protein